MEVPLLDLRAQYAAIRDRVRAAVDGVLDTQQCILGANVAALEEEVARYCGVPYAVAVASGTDALLIALRALGVGPGDAAVTVPYTFFATAGAIANLGARPMFVDIDPLGYNMDSEQLARFFERECKFNMSSNRLIHRSTGLAIKAVVPVHLYGQCADMDPISELARCYRVPVVEDSCQAIGARYRDRMAGTMGDAGCFSFFPTKNLGGAGDGGMVVTARKDLAEQIRLLRTHGAQPKYYHSVVGYNSRLDEIQAAVLRVKLGSLDGWIEGRQRNAAHYDQAFRNAGLAAKVSTPVTMPQRSHTYHQYVIRATDRDKLRSALHSRGIGTEIYYPVPLHQQECFGYLGYSSGDFPNSRAAAAETLALPVYPELTRAQLDHVVESIRHFHFFSTGSDQLKLLTNNELYQ